MNQRTPDSVFPLHYWYVEGTELAEQLGVKTAGDVYLVKGTEGEGNF